MRTAFHEQLAALTKKLSEICGLATAAIDAATRALLTADLELAEQVIDDHRNVVGLSEEAWHQAVSLIALQQPVAGDLRALFSAIQIAADVHRMSALAVHVAKIARRRHPNCAVPEEVQDCFAAMGKVAVQMGNTARDVLLSRDPGKAAKLRTDDDAMDNLHRRLFTVLMDHGRWTHGVAAAVDVALLARFYERFSDHAVEIGRRVVFEAVGTLPEQQPVATYCGY